jgi:hypothetical protein
MTMSDVDQGPSDDELFNEAISDETPDAPVVSEQAEQPVRTKLAGSPRRKSRKRLKWLQRCRLKSLSSMTTLRKFPHGAFGRSTRKSGRHLLSWKPCGPSVPNGSSAAAAAQA